MYCDFTLHLGQISLPFASIVHVLCNGHEALMLHVALSMKTGAAGPTNQTFLLIWK